MPKKTSCDHGWGDHDAYTGAKLFSIAAAALAFSGLVMVAPGAAVAKNGALQMSAPARMLHVRKHIRWHVWTLFEHQKKSVVGFDLAPDVGMYS